MLRTLTFLVLFLLCIPASAQTNADAMQRLVRAAQLLEQAAGTVSEVAYAVGYRDPDHFAKQFRREHGIPPSAYAAEHAARAGKD